MRQQNIRVERGAKGFGLSFIYKVSGELTEGDVTNNIYGSQGLDKFTKEETGTYVTKVRDVSSFPAVHLEYL
jgi:hypothetical protein